MAHTDSTGTVHTDHCWRMAVVTLNEEISLQTLPAAFLDWADGDYRIEIWDGAIAGNVVADWLSDGTATCICNQHKD